MKTSVLCFGFVAVACASTRDINLRQAPEVTPRKWTVGQTVQTTSGAVTGHAAKNQTGVSEYLGIPFAKPPIGDLRFEAPVKFIGNSSINGTAYGPSCPVAESTSSITAASLDFANVTSVGIQYFSIFSASQTKFDEDCLYANVWTKPQTGEAKKAVLVWIYGGGFSSGSSGTPGYNGANIAEQEDVIVVSFNYRLSILGFPGNPATPANLAFMDQRLAIEWVRDNIENFGGDASRITIFGESAGAVSVDIYSYAYNDDPIAAGFIPESGTVFSWGLPNSKALAASSWYDTVKNLGCGDNTTDSATILSCMRSKNTTVLLAGMAKATGTASILGYFGPTVDEKIVFSNYSGRTPANRPMLVGNNNYESGLFRTQFALNNLTFPDRYWNAFDLQEFTCPAGIRANASVAAKNPTWRYRYMGVWENTKISNESGTFHTAEIPLLFNTAPQTPPATAEYVAVANYMRGAWAAFAKDPVKGLTNYGWPEYNISTDSLIRIAYQNKTGTNAVNPSLYDANCRYVNVSSTNSSGYETIPFTSDETPSSTPVSTPTPSPTGGASPSETKNAGVKTSASLFAIVMGAAMMCL